jgi:inosine-uridine preferring nucleoside hydrolase
MRMLFTISLSWRLLRILCDLCYKAFNCEGRKGFRKVRRGAVSLLPVLMLPLLLSCISVTQTAATKAAPGKIIIDTDIGDDIDDAFAVALALRSPQLQILGISTTFGDTETRAKL